MNSKEIIVSDNSIVDALTSGDNEICIAAQLIIEFLAWRNYNKKILTIPKIYDMILGKINNNGDLKAYFENFFGDARFIGISDKNPDEQEFISLLSTLYLTGHIVIFVSENKDLCQSIKNKKLGAVVVKNLMEMKEFLQSKNGFYSFIDKKYYDSSA